MGQALYRKYRSKSFDEVVGQDHITTTLKNALKTGRISHAYLFTGPRGVGKTSVARILAHEVNNLPYDDDSTHLDIIEIDAASNRRIDEIRDLREKVHTAPTAASYKVYIIDEVHMLTREAFNALLKTLEEPPAHCIFVLATTEAHKLPETIVSRTQRFNFKPIIGKEGTEHLKNIAKKEKIEIDPSALDLIYQHGEGSFRDSIGILDQLSNLSKKVSLDDVRQFLGLAPDSAISELASAITAGDGSKALRILDELKGQGTNAPKVASQLAKLSRSELIAGKKDTWRPVLLRQLLLVPSSPSPYDQLEISILEACAGRSPENDPESSGRSGKASTQQEKSKAVDEISSINSKKTPRTDPTSQTMQFDLSVWPDVITMVKTEAASLYTALRLATPSLDNKSLSLAFQFPLHQKKVSQAKNIEIIGRIIEENFGSKVSVRCIVDKNSLPPAELSDAGPLAESLQLDQPNSLKTISNIFGSAEVLES